MYYTLYNVTLKKEGDKFILKSTMSPSNEWDTLTGRKIMQSVTKKFDTLEEVYDKDMTYWEDGNVHDRNGDWVNAKDIFNRLTKDLSEEVVIYG